MSTSIVSRVALYVPIALYLCVVAPSVYAFVVQDKIEAILSIGVLSLPSSLGAGLLLNLITSDSNGLGSLAILLLFGVAQYLIVGFVLREAFESLFDARKLPNR